MYLFSNQIFAIIDQNEFLNVEDIVPLKTTKSCKEFKKEGSLNGHPRFITIFINFK